jgi:hypothetical protein
MNRVAEAHADWLSLLDSRGQFLTLPVLREAFPGGLDRAPASTRDAVRDRIANLDDDPATRTTWLEFLLRDVLNWGPRLRSGPAVPADLSHVVAEHHTTLRADYALVTPASDGSPERARALVVRFPLGTDLTTRIAGDTWAATPIERVALLCRATGVPIGIATDTNQLTLVWAPIGSASGHGTWPTALLGEEHALLDSLVSLLGAKRFFAVAADAQLDSLLTRAAAAEHDVTTQLGQQVRQAVELLVGALSRANNDHGGRLLAGVDPHAVYSAAVTVMMRLVFLLYAEERRLLPLADPLYADNYAASTLREELQGDADRDGDEPLELRTAAWHRLLATFRAVHAGITHDQLRLPAYGGTLFDPDRYPFLEGRTDAESWQQVASAPLPVDDATVLAVLNALQVLRIRDGGVTESRRLSFRTLDVEQIGHVYEGLLDHDALRVTETAVGLVGKAGLEPEVPLAAIEERAAAGRPALLAWLRERTGKSDSWLTTALDTAPDVDLLRLLRTACENDAATVERVTPYVRVLRPDLRDLPMVFRPGSVYVTETSSRRDSGTEYTTKDLADEVVTHALAPLVYLPGPADGADPANWKLRPSVEILRLRVCDPAVGSGAILVAACRYLAERVLEAWVTEGGGSPLSGDGGDGPSDLLIDARRLVADRCLFGVDRDPMAVEMAKLSLWLTTMARDRPFSFLDHALRAGDSLLGVTDIRQVELFHADPARASGQLPFAGEVQLGIKAALNKRQQLESIRVLTLRDAESKARLNTEADQALASVHVVADLIVGAAMVSARANVTALDDRLAAVAARVADALDPEGDEENRSHKIQALQALADSWLNADRPPEAPVRRPLHWPVVFPEVFAEGGFSAFVGNPPYMGNKYWRERIGPEVQSYWERQSGKKLGKPDLVVLFLWRMHDLLRPGGCFGSLATQSLTEVQAKSLFVALVLSDSQLYRAVASRKWPGSANVTVAIVWATRGEWQGPRILDGVSVPGIGADLRPTDSSDASDGTPHVLGDRMYAFQGVDNSKGLAFVIDETSELGLSDPDQRYIRPYVSGEDLTADPRALPRRVIDLSTLRGMEDLASLPVALRDYVANVVRPTRTDRELRPYKGLIDRWWTFWNPREEGYSVARRNEDVVVVPAVSKHLLALRMPSNLVYTNMVIVVALGRPDVQDLLLSSPFDVWAERHGGTMEKRRRMKVASVFYTFPLPEARSDGSLSAGWQAETLGLVASMGGGITDVLNAKNDITCSDSGVTRLRDLQRAIDEVVLASYGWGDIAPTYDFFDTFFGVRFTMDPRSLNEVHRRLLALNHARHTAETEVRGRHRRSASRTGKSKTAAPASGTLELFPTSDEDTQ